MNKVDEFYKDLLSEILSDGFEYDDPNRKGTKRKQIPTADFFLFAKDNPVISLRKVYFKGAVAELLLFLKGSTDIRDYWKAKVNFWNADFCNYQNISSEYLQLLKNNPEIEDDKRFSLGKIYGHQYARQYEVFDNFKENPYRTDLIIDSWQLDSLDDMSLRPCHFLYQLIKEDDGFMLKWSQRSVDTLLGLPMNIVFYFLMGKILEIWSGHKFTALEGDLRNVHLYDNQYELAEEVSKVTAVDKVHEIQIDSSSWELDKPFEEFIKSVKYEDFKLVNYEPVLNKTVEMLAYKK